MDKEPLLDSTQKDSKKTKIPNCIIGWIGMIIYLCRCCSNSVFKTPWCAENTQNVLKPIVNVNLGFSIPGLESMGPQSRLLSLEEIYVFSDILHSLLISLRYCTYVYFYCNCDTIYRCQCSFYFIISHYMQNSTKQDKNYCKVSWVCRFCYNCVKCVYQRLGRVGCFNWRSFSFTGMYRKSMFLLNFGSFA